MIFFLWNRQFDQNERLGIRNEIWNPLKRNRYKLTEERGRGGVEEEIKLLGRGGIKTFFKSKSKAAAIETKVSGGYFPLISSVKSCFFLLPLPLLVLLLLQLSPSCLVVLFHFVFVSFYGTTALATSPTLNEWEGKKERKETERQRKISAEGKPLFFLFHSLSCFKGILYKYIKRNSGIYIYMQEKERAHTHTHTHTHAYTHARARTGWYNLIIVNCLGASSPKLFPIALMVRFVMEATLHYSKQYDCFNAYLSFEVVPKWICNCQKSDKMTRKLLWNDLLLIFFWIVLELLLDLR